MMQIKGGVYLKSFKTKIYFTREKSENREVTEKAEKCGFSKEAISGLYYLGYEVEVEVEIFEDGTVNILNQIQL